MLRKSKKVEKVLILLPILILVITGSYFIHKFKSNQNIYKDTDRVMNTISQVLDLSTVKYKYTNVITVKKDKSINEMKIPFTEKSFIIKYNGIINGGVKPEDIKIVKNNGESIQIQIDKCEILDHYIDSDNIYVYDVKSSLFNKLEIQEVLDDINKYKKEYEEKALKEGLMEEIKRSTKTSIQNMLKNIGYKNVVVEFK
ncbi:DUF4230 domain-containing protein [Romboutsia lituseburensis]|uniref:DUF4230 domain-containing protein n=1 Tax=Romboutsia lituseburensis DSM 797 TaxID=1121325 RepID=A0A1G9QZ86_9FIRM|nr:DUF4230 domain-containing protein [Romboutsia lituseburensis]CEH35811.1 Protein of unknown function (DUF4230) [Romboutsia lituseburensis]SDM16253.1 Protein of unknown function [Romboutsia lituseburensis DSM 797]